MNVIKFKSFKNKPLVFCVLDTTASIIDPWAKEIVKNQADYTIQNLYNKGYTIFQGSDEDLLLKEASLDFDYACLISTGTEFLNGETALISLEEECTENFLVKGHILDRKDAYYELHQQCYLINLKIYRSLDFPIIGKQILGEVHITNCPIRSKENIHDDYTPLWIKSGDSTLKYSHKCHGWNIIKISLDCGYTINSFSNSIRSNKKHLYPESLEDFYKHVELIYKRERYCANEFVHTANTEWPNRNISGLRQIVTPASGEWYIEMLDKEQPCTVILYDYNLRSLEYWRENVTKIKNVTYKFVHWDLLGEFINLSTHLDNSLENCTLINLSNIFCYEGTTSLSPVKYRLIKENQILEFLKKSYPNALVNFAARASSGFISDNHYIDTAKNISMYNISLLKKPTWHYSDWR
jgi:hypothetical protein